jgi:hypothetical protein
MLQKNLNFRSMSNTLIKLNSEYQHTLVITGALYNSVRIISDLSDNSWALQGPGFNFIEKE